MKTICYFFSIILLPHLAFAQNFMEKPYLIKKFETDRIKNLIITTEYGGLCVIGTDKSESKLEVYIKTNKLDDGLNKQEIEEILQNYDLSILQEGNTVRVSFEGIKNKSNTRKILNVFFKAYVPKNTITNLITYAGSIDVSGITSNVIGTTKGGSIEIKNCKNKINLKTSGGSIYANNCTGDIELNTSGGSITLDTLKGDIKAITSGGSINGIELYGQSYLITKDGSILLRAIHGSLEASTELGGIDAEIQKLDKYLTLNAFKGDMIVKLSLNQDLDLDCLASKILSNVLNNFNGQLDDTHIKGKLNGGGIPVKLLINRGNLTIENL